MARKLHDMAGRLTATRFDTPTASLLDAVVSGPESDDLLTARLQALPLNEAVGLLLDKAVAANTPIERRNVANLIVNVCRERTADITAFSASTHAAAWRTLIADEGSITNGGTPVANSFLSLNEALFASTNVLPPEADGPRWGYSSDHYDDSLRQRSPGRLAAQMIDTYGEDGRALVRARVLARLAGIPESELPKYPHQAPPTQAEAAGLRRRFAAVTNRDDAARLVSEQPLPIKVVLPEILCDDPTLNARLTGLAATVTNITVTDDAFKAIIAPWLNRPVDPALIRTLSDYCLRQGSNQVGVLCQIERKSDFGGCTVSVQTAPANLMAAGINDGEHTNNLRRVVGVTGLVCARGILGAARWRFTELPEKRGWGTFTASDPSTLRQMDQAIADFCNGKADAASAGVVRFLAKGPGQ